MKKKLFSLFLAICMMISLVPVTAFADEDDHVAANEAEYNAFAPGAGKYMIELIFSYNGDFNGNLLGGFELCENPVRPEYSNPDNYISYSDGNGIKTKMIFTKPTSDINNMYNAAYFRFYPSYGCKISGIAQGTQVFGDVYNLPVGQFTTQETYQQLYVRLNDDGSFSTSVGIRAGNYEDRQQLYISFKRADPSEIPNAPTNPYWDDTTARWDEVSGADNYKVSLYEKYGTNGYLLITSDYITTNYYDFSAAFTDYLPTDKNYVFKVEAIKNKVRSGESVFSGERAGLHTHTPAAGWQYDGEYHWKECDDCGRAYAVEEHTISALSLGMCTTCGIVPYVVKKCELGIAPTLGGTPATTDISFYNLNTFQVQANWGTLDRYRSIKWYKKAENDYTGPSVNGSTTGWIEMGADEQFVTGFMYRVDVDFNYTDCGKFFIKEDTAYRVYDSVKRENCVSGLYKFDAENVIRLSGYFNPLGAPVTPPSRPSREPDPEPTYLPYITDEKEMTWDEVCEYLKTLNDGDEVDIHLGGADVVPEKVMTVIADKELKVNFIYSYAKRWFVDGAKIDSPAETNFAISAKTSPDTSELRGVVGTSFEVFGANFPIEQTISFKTEHAGKFANLYKIVDDKPVFVAAVRIDADGKAKFADMSAEGEYVIMISEYSDLPGDMDNDGNVNVNDAIAVLKQAAGAKTGENPLVADLNNDNKINVLDAVLILKKAAGRK